MNKIVTIGLGAAAVVLAIVVGLQLFGSPTGGTGAGGDDPTATPDQTPTPEPSPSEAAALPLTQSFTSNVHGISVSYPEEWVDQAATEPWTAGTFPFNITLPNIDVLHDPVAPGGLGLTFASQLIADRYTSAEDWLLEQMASDEGCATTVPITVDGADGLIGSEGCDVTVVTAAGRGYWIQLYTSGDDPAAVAAYDRDWFEDVLATVQLSPQDAVDAGPSSSP